jgi:hypothetical protein
MRLERLDQPSAGSLDTKMLRCPHRCRLAASAQFRQDLFRDFAICASKEFRYDAEVDATSARNLGKLESG